MNPDEVYMQRALELAALGRGSVSPNPMVGCVIVHENKIIGEGWHQRYSGPHAEVNAVQSVADKTLLREATAYVTLEPCSHFGKTPPCADLLVQHQLKRVVICNTDSNPLVSGKGIAKLQAAGIAVTTGILAEQGRALNSRFFTFMEQQRPYVILKWAQTADGYIARSNHDSKWISHALSRTLVHKWRAEEDAICVGTRTALHDNPQLNVRSWSGRNPVRVVLDKQLQLPAHLHLFDRSQPTLCYNYLKEESLENLTYVRLDEHQPVIRQIWNDLYGRRIQSLIVEGGSRLLQSIIDAGLWDEIRIFRSEQTFGEGIAAPVFRGVEKETTLIQNDRLSLFTPAQ